jgi:hypothetical protein
MLGLVLPIVLVALLVAALSRREVRATPLVVRWAPLAACALAIQLALYNPPIDEQSWALGWGPWIYVATMLAVLVVLVRNGLPVRRERAAWLVAAAGVGLNVLVVSANGGYMPQSPAARETLVGTVDTVTEASPSRHLANVVPLTSDTRLPWLGDIIPQPRWMPLANVISIGDLLLSGGIAWAVLGSALGSVRIDRRRGSWRPSAPLV